MPKLVLASTSAYRRLQLEQLGLVFETVCPAYDEEHHLNLPADRLVVHLARRKAESVAPGFKDALVIGSDQLLVAQGRLAHKPADAAGAVSAVQSLSGKEHLLMTAVAVVRCRDGRTEWDLDLQRVRLRRLDRSAVERYVRREKPMDCVAGLKVEGLGITLLEYAITEDPSAVFGLPLIRLLTVLRKFGVRLF